MNNLGHRGAAWLQHRYPATYNLPIRFLNWIDVASMSSDGAFGYAGSLRNSRTMADNGRASISDYVMPSQHITGGRVG